MRLFYSFINFIKKFFRIFNLKNKIKVKKISEVDFGSSKKGPNCKTELVEERGGPKDNKKLQKDDKFFVDQITDKKNKRKKVLSGIFSIVLCNLTIIFLIISPTLLFNKKNYQTDINDLLLSQKNVASVLTLWHIETFEGGSASRTKFLENQAIAFNKEQKNCFVVIKTLNENQLFLNLEQGNCPDLFSFGIGSGYMISSILATLPKNEYIREDLQRYSIVNEEVLAYPYIMGGYLTITREKDYNKDNVQDNFISISNKSHANKNLKQKLGFGLSTGEFTNGLKSLECEASFALSNKDLYKCTSTYEAYTCFLQNKFKTLVGTTRDLARCKNREANGNLESCVYSYLGGFTDLVQYIGVNKNISSAKLKLASRFAKHLTEDVSQKAISNYGLFGVTKNKIYRENFYSVFEDTLMESLSSINVFSPLKEIENAKQQTITKLLG